MNKAVKSKLLDLLKNIPGCNKVIEKDIEKWMNMDKNIELTDSKIIPW